ncbi:MAG: glutamate synthase-related protein [Methanomassiliicoccales archaeon]
MTVYLCDVCKTFEYDSERGNSLTGIRPGTEPEDFPDDWRCPICASDKSHLKPKEEKRVHQYTGTLKCPHCGAENEVTIKTGEVNLDRYLGEWGRDKDELEVHMADIHRMAVTGESILEPMRTTREVISWDDILIRGAQLSRMPLNKDEEVSTETVIGPSAEKPLRLDIPLYVTHMSFGALSREVKMALAMGSAAMGTAMCSGEGGILRESMERAHRYVFEYVPNKYSVTEENLRRVDAVEIKIGQSTKPGMGGQLPAEKVTQEISEIRGFSQGTDIISPARFDDIQDGEGLREKVDWLRERTGGRPIGVKMAAGHVEADLEVAVQAEPDFITLDGRPGATAASPKMVKWATSVPTVFALHRARRFLDREGLDHISLVITGGLRVSPDFAKALAMGADAVAIGTAALMACACQQYRLCDTGKCPVGVTTQDPDLRDRLKVRYSAKRLENFLAVSVEELRDFARLTGRRDVHHLSVTDLCTYNSEISDHTDIDHV